MLLQGVFFDSYGLVCYTKKCGYKGGCIKWAIIASTQVLKSVSASNKHGWYDFVPNLDRPCLLVLPDGGTTNDRAGSGMLKEFESKVYGVQTVVFDKNAAETFLNTYVKGK